MSIKPVEVCEVTCDASGPYCQFAGAYDSANYAVANAVARREGWRVYGNRVVGFRHKCPECVKTRTPLEKLP